MTPIAPGMRIIVTGASGFVGQRIVARLVAAGHNVVAATRQPGCFPGANQCVAPDLGPDADWSSIVHNADIVVHAAARVHVMHERERNPLAVFRHVNVEGTRALANAAAQAGVRRFLFISSIKVNGEHTDDRMPFAPDDAPAPIDPYGVSKHEAEVALSQIGDANGMETVAIRPVLIHGAGVKGNMASFARLAARGWPLRFLPLGAVKNRRSLVHVDNLADMIAAVVAHPGPLPKVMLIRDDESPSTPELLQRMAYAAGKKVRLAKLPPQWLSAAARGAGRAAIATRLLGSLEVDDSTTRAALGWRPPMTLDAGLADTIAGSTRR